MLKAGVVILNYNRPNLVLKLCMHIKEFSNISKIVVIDNNSTDNSADILKQIVDEKTILICNKQNSGYAKGNNIGLKLLKEEYNFDLAFVINPDVWLEEDVVNHIIEAAQKYPQYVVLSTFRVHDSNRRCLQYSEPFDTYWRQFFSNFILSRQFLKKKYYTYEKNRDSEIIEVGEIPGSMWAVKLDFMQSIGYMDEGTFLFCEELCLAKKVKLAGKKEAIVTSVIYEHNHYANCSTKQSKNINSYKYKKDSRWFFINKYIDPNGFMSLLMKISFVWNRLEFEVIYFITNLLRR